MKNKAAIIVVLLAVAALAIAGCSRFFQPSDAEVLKAISDSRILQNASFTIAPPLVIVGREKQNRDGSWPVKVKMTMTLKTPDGKASEPRENTATFLILKSKDAKGQTAWMAKLGY